MARHRGKRCLIDFTRNQLADQDSYITFSQPFIVPSLFEVYENDSSKYVVDEYTLTQEWNSEGGQALVQANMKQHYDTFITEQDFAQIAAAGLNWVRLPIAYWAVTTMANEPFVEGLSWQYFLKAIQWARKYGIRIELDLHAVPGSQNGYNHGGRLGTFNFLNSPTGLVSAQRTLDIIRTIIEFINQPDIANVVPAFGILNEPNLPVGIGINNIERFYVEVYTMFRNITGFGAGKGPMMFFHDGFMGLPTFNGFMQGGDRIGWDLHPYNCFVSPFGPRSGLVASACNNFASNTELGLTQYGVTIAGEWSLANNDCGLFLNGPFQGVRYDGSFSSGTEKNEGSCVPFDDWQNYNASTKQVMHDSAIAQMSSFKNYFFWTWKIGNSLRTGGPVNPNWSYKLGYDNGWMPTNPYVDSQSACSVLQATYPAITKTSITWSSTFADYQTGAASTYTPNTVSYSWPPPSLASSGTQTASSLAATLQPTYTATGPHLTVSIATPTVSVKNEPVPTLNPWAAGVYTQPAYVAIPNCNYFADIWANATTTMAGWPCGTGLPQARDLPNNRFQKRFPLHPQPTPMPDFQR
jgi:glucan 1,3-beta-glucosidase